MGEPGFTPVDETEGFTPVEDTPPTTMKPMADPMTGSVSTMGAAEPSAWQRIKSALPIIDRVETGLGQAGASMGLSTPSPAAAVAKPLPGMDTQQAIAPERALTSSEREAQPIMSPQRIATDLARNVGGMTTPENALLTTMTAGPAPELIGKALGYTFAGQALKGAYNSWAPLREAADRKDWAEVESLGTDMVFGATMGMLGVRRAVRGESPFEELSQSGREFRKVQQAQKSREAIEKNGVGLYNKVRDSVITHKATLEQQANDALQPTIDKDNAQPPAISTAGAISEAAKTIAKTGYTPTAAETKLLNKMQTGGDSNLADVTAQNLGYKNAAEAKLRLPPAAWDSIVAQTGGEGTSHISLEEAKLLRTAVGRIAFGKNTKPESKAVFTTAYKELTDAARQRATELDGNPKRFDFHNNRYKMSFELDKGVAGDMLDSLQGQDANASINPLKSFSTGNIKEIQQQMRQTGNRQLADQLGKSQQDATALTSAHDAVSGKFSAGVYRMLQAHPKQAWPGLAVMAAAHGVGLPFPLPQIAGAGAAAWNVGRIAKNASVDIGSRLQSELPESKFQTRTTPMEGDFGDEPTGGGGTPPESPLGSPGNPRPAGPSSSGPPVPQGNTAENAARSGGFYDQVKKEHPDWTVSQQLMEAAKRENAPAKKAPEDSNVVRERRVDNVDPAAEKAEKIRMILQQKQGRVDNAKTGGEHSTAVADLRKFQSEQKGYKSPKDKAQQIHDIVTKKTERKR